MKDIAVKTTSCGKRMTIGKGIIEPIAEKLNLSPKTIIPTSSFYRLVMRDWRSQTDYIEVVLPLEGYAIFPKDFEKAVLKKIKILASVSYRLSGVTYVNRAKVTIAGEGTKWVSLQNLIFYSTKEDYFNEIASGKTFRKSIYFADAYVKERYKFSIYKVDEIRGRYEDVCPYVDCDIMGAYEDARGIFISIDNKENLAVTKQAAIEKSIVQEVVEFDEDEDTLIDIPIDTERKSTSLTITLSFNG